jgi:DNA-binding Xre family transcriptional regulator
MIRSRLGILLAEENVKRARLGQPRLTQTALAKQTNVPLRTINHLALNKNTRIDHSTLDRLCKFFGVQPGALFEYTADEEAET